MNYIEISNECAKEKLQEIKTKFELNNIKNNLIEIQKLQCECYAWISVGNKELKKSFEQLHIALYNQHCLLILNKGGNLHEHSR